MPPRPTVARIAPGQSIRFPASFSSRLSGTFHALIARTAAASGTFRKNAQRQERWSMSHPPRTGPAAAVIEVKPDHVPIARPRSLGGKVEARIARLPGTSSAPPTPWTARAAMSCRTSGASPHQTEAPAKTAVPIAKTRLRPKRSPSAPPARRSAASSSAYASTTHWTSTSVAWNCAWMAGRATLTTVPSMKAMLEPRMVAARTHGESDFRCAPARPRLVMPLSRRIAMRNAGFARKERAPPGRRRAGGGSGSGFYCGLLIRKESCVKSAPDSMSRGPTQNFTVC